MLVSKNKGITLLETIVSMLIISTILIGALTFYGVMKRAEEEERKEMKATYQIDAVKKLILCNMDYDDIKAGIVEKTRFINNDDLEKENIGRVNIKHIIKDEVKQYPLIMLMGTEEISREIIKIEIIYRFQDGKEINYVFYKGNYKKS
ncbi:prepilin-type N-terminal cleavage/methylation domain-containing protein [Clostridium sp.]|uniref:type IV pilus modification PilV family protein n=1 Tax=Clostridium sp. TaxID=1506 RepID=UPI003217D008